MIRKTSLFITLLIIGKIAHSEILTVGMDVGYDSNPFKFSNLHPIVSDSYIETRAKYRQRFETGLYLISNLKSSIYLGDADNANKTRFNFGGGFKTRYKIYSIKSHFKIEARQYLIDQTYVSRISGQVATFSGVEIPDRYNANWTNINVHTDFRFNDSLEIDFTYQNKTKNYVDLTALGLSNLDYSQNFLQSRIIYNQDEENRFRVGAESGLRVYDNRIAKQVNGDDILGSNLEYNYSRYSFEYRNKKGNATGSFGFDAELREDNGGGFYDTVTSSAFTKLKYKKKSGSFISIKLSYVNSKFDNAIPLSLVQNDEQIRSREGFAFDLEYNRNLIDFGYKELFFHLKYSYEDFDNADPFYVYDKSLFQAGINWGIY